MRRIQILILLSILFIFTTNVFAAKDFIIRNYEKLICKLISVIFDANLNDCLEGKLPTFYGSIQKNSLITYKLKGILKSDPDFRVVNDSGEYDKGFASAIREIKNLIGSQKPNELLTPEVIPFFFPYCNLTITSPSQTEYKINSPLRVEWIGGCIFQQLKQFISTKPKPFIDSQILRFINLHVYLVKKSVVDNPVCNSNNWPWLSDCKSQLIATVPLVSRFFIWIPKNVKICDNGTTDCEYVIRITLENYQSFYSLLKERGLFVPPGEARLFAESKKFKIVK